MKWYIRYADDFVILDQNRNRLEVILGEIGNFLDEKLHLALHPNKISIETFAGGVDFLGWVHFQNHRVLRTATKKRMFRNIEIKKGQNDLDKLNVTVQSYLGVLSHGNGYELGQCIKL